MKKINKDLAVIPPSLVIGDDKLTHQRRLELIAKKHYINEAPYNDRYKTDDIRDRLVLIYNNKCAFANKRLNNIILNILDLSKFTTG